MKVKPRYFHKLCKCLILSAKVSSIDPHSIFSLYFDFGFQIRQAKNRENREFQPFTARVVALGKN